MTRDMYDGINTDAPKIARLRVPISLVAGYDDGLYAWSDADWALFPNSTHVHIAVFATTNSGHVLDVEQGDATPEQSVDWVLTRRRAGVDPTVYCNTSTWPQVRAAFRARGVAEPHYWVAQYDGDPTIPPGAIAKQYLNDDAAGYDRSAVADYWPGVDDPRDPDNAEHQPITVPSARRNDMHADLKPNTPVVFTNPAAVLGGASTLLLAADFGTAVVRVAVLSFKTDTWSLATYTLTPTGGATRIELPADTNKVSVTLLSATAASPFPTSVGMDVLA